MIRSLRLFHSQRHRFNFYSSISMSAFLARRLASSWVRMSPTSSIHVHGSIHHSTLTSITLEVTRITLTTGLFIIGAQLPGSFMYKHVKSLLVMIVLTMAIGWIIVAAFIKVLFPILGFVACLAIASCLTPTDPIISAAIVGGKYAEENVRAPLTILSPQRAQRMMDWPTHF